MIKALQEGWIAGAGLDVLETEPVGHNNPLLGMDNVILTSHVASASSRFDVARKRRVGAELSLVAVGQVAARLRQSRDPGEIQAPALAALLDGARAGEPTRFGGLISSPVIRGRIQEGESVNDDLSKEEIMIGNSLGIRSYASLRSSPASGGGEEESGVSPAA